MQSYCKLKSSTRSISKWVTCSSLLLLLGLPQCFSHPTYEWQDSHTNERLVCEQCPPGTCVSQHCTRESPTICKQCPTLHYTEYWNYLENCLYCNTFCNFLEEEAQPCNSTQNRVCQCKPGYHAELDFCIEHSSCPPGSGVAQLGNPQQDTKCTQCPQGTFSSVSSMDPCRTHQNCSAQHLEVNVPGSQFHDTFCTACNISKGTETSEGSEDGSGSEDCQDAVIDFVPYEIKVPRRLRRLKRILSESSQESKRDRKSLEELQIELHSYLVQLKNMEKKELLVQRLLRALQRMKLQHILQKIQKRYSIAL
ncbi:tumor necrosis factor receptor superfamily member 6B [Sceloporus undulatus]|uniref:tumor necrosis factor receptor superfamily member 6B n=1 Tax=Sceloporus undulatus TaxID=8520 RepID=UPI001C4B587A|nr:tumor necrosis factor receptor superfamily member 6B [Sceloporus undulatus]XP_042320119.1 tumor necrosis factor receptor superfamily member 6B [Sceloporus undulatus]